MLTTEAHVQGKKYKSWSHYTNCVVCFAWGEMKHST